MAKHVSIQFEKTNTEVISFRMDTQRARCATQGLRYQFNIQFETNTDQELFIIRINASAYKKPVGDFETKEPVARIITLTRFPIPGLQEFIIDNEVEKILDINHKTVEKMASVSWLITKGILLEKGRGTALEKSQIPVIQGSQILPENIKLTKEEN